MAKLTKKLEKAYAAHNVPVIDGMIIVDGIAVNPLLKDGNTKTGPRVKTFSTLPGDKEYNTEHGKVKGTCPFTCPGCYGTCGFYNFPDNKNKLAANTVLCREHLDTVDAAIRAQLDTLPGVDIRIHATGDFIGDAYAEMWRNIACDYKNNHFWTYTKVEKYETLFDGLENANIVKSLLPFGGFNFGHIEYIFRAYVKLVDMGAAPYICRCTFDTNQHCQDCRGCIENKYVLFVEHSTGYVAAEDPLFAAACEIVDAQKNNPPAVIAARIRELLNI